MLPEVLNARKLRLGVIRNFWQMGLLDESTAKELLAGPLSPGDSSTIYDDSQFLNDPDGLTRDAELPLEPSEGQGGASPTEDDTVHVGRVQDDEHAWL